MTKSINAPLHETDDLLARSFGRNHNYTTGKRDEGFPDDEKPLGVLEIYLKPMFNVVLLPVSDAADLRVRARVRALMVSDAADDHSFARVGCLLMMDFATFRTTEYLNVPYNAAEGGWIAVGLVVLCAVMANYTGKALIKCLYASPGQRRLESYADIGDAAFGKAGRFAANLFQKVTLMGIGVIFLILCGIFLSSALPPLDSHDSDYWQTRWIWICACIVLVPILVLKTLREVALLSMLGMSATFITVISVVVLSLVDYYNPDVRGDVGNATLFGEHTFFNSSGFAAAFGSITLAFGGASVCPTIEGHMPQPEQFPVVYNWAFIALMIMYLPTVVSGYFVYGNLAQAPILQSLPSSGAAGQMVTAVQLIITVHLLCAYPIVINVVSEEVERNYKIDNKHRTPVMAIILRSIVRIALVMTTATIAYFVPHIAQVQDVLGAISLVFMVYILPTAFNMKLRYAELGKIELGYNVFILILGLAGGGFGAYQSINSLIDAFK